MGLVDIFYKLYNNINHIIKLMKKSFSRHRFFQINTIGFTLIELLVVIAIIGILSSMVLVSLGGARAKARNARRESDIRQIVLAVELDYSDDEKYSQCNEMPIKIPCTDGGCACANPSDGKYLDPIPEDPKGGAYNWIDNSSGATNCDDERYCVWVLLEDEGKYFAGSEKGTRKLDDEPTDCPCW